MSEGAIKPSVPLKAEDEKTPVVSEKSEELNGNGEEKKNAPVVAEAHQVDTFREFCQR
jgi:hypothetical protein